MYVQKIALFSVRQSSFLTENTLRSPSASELVAQRRMVGGAVGGEKVRFIAGKL
jgi:hypothetical protein